MDSGGEGNCPEEFEICLDTESYDELIVMMEEAGVEMDSEMLELHLAGILIQ